MQLQITPCTAQLARHTSDKSWPAKLRAGSTTILAAVCTNFLISLFAQYKVLHCFIKFGALFQFFAASFINAALLVSDFLVELGLLF